MNIEKRISAFVKLKNFFTDILNKKDFSDSEFAELANKFQQIIQTEHLKNGWFTPESIKFSIKSISENLSQENLELWLLKYKLKSLNKNPKKIGVILAGNLPLVGFHDFLCVLITGNIFVGKMSSKDNRLLETIAEILIKIEEGFTDYIIFEEGHLKDIEAIIATGSNNSARYFEYYFGKYPNIIRKNRNSLAILDGNESKEQIEKLGDDIFTYFGLGCRNVSKIFIPKGFNLSQLFEGFVKYSDIINHNKYANNYSYNRAIFLMDLKQFYDNNFVILKEDSQISSPISVIFYEYYSDIKEVINYIKINMSQIQCVSTDIEIYELPTVKLGETQKPKLWDYSDNVDTVNFLNSL